MLRTPDLPYSMLQRISMECSAAVFSTGVAVKVLAQKQDLLGLYECRPNTQDGAVHSYTLDLEEHVSQCVKSACTPCQTSSPGFQSTLASTLT